MCGIVDIAFSEKHDFVQVGQPVGEQSRDACGEDGVEDEEAEFELVESEGNDILDCAVSLGVGRTDLGFEEREYGG